MRADAGGERGERRHRAIYIFRYQPRYAYLSLCTQRDSGFRTAGGRAGEVDPTETATITGHRAPCRRNLHGGKFAADMYQPKYLLTFTHPERMLVNGLPGLKDLTRFEKRLSETVGGRRDFPSGPHEAGAHQGCDTQTTENPSFSGPSAFPNTRRAVFRRLHFAQTSLVPGVGSRYLTPPHSAWPEKGTCARQPPRRACKCRLRSPCYCKRHCR